MPYDDERPDPALPAADGGKAEIAYLASRLGWAEQQAASYQRDYEQMLTARNDLHRELLRANGSLKAFREENAALKQQPDNGTATLRSAVRRGVRALVRKAGPSTGNASPSARKTESDPATAGTPIPAGTPITAGTPAPAVVPATTGTPAAEGEAAPSAAAPYPVPPRTLSPAYTPEADRVLVVADTEDHTSAARRAAALGRDVVVLHRPGYPWDSGRPFGYPRRISDNADGITRVYSPDADIRADQHHHFLDRAADAIVREARLHRPAVLLADGGEATCRAVLVAGRRLGIAVAFEPLPELPASLELEADADPLTLAPLEGRGTVPLRDLDGLHAGVVCDEFTGRLLENTLRTTAVTAQGWRQQLETEQWDALIVESAWLGNGGAWEISDYYTDQKGYENLAALVEACSTRGIPTVFWNKEDPIHYRRFRRVAALFDHVVTTDSGSLPHYQENPRARGRTHSSLTFFADPVLHNPLPGKTAPETAVAYAGTYYGSRFPERSEQMLRLFAASQPHGPVIFDRHSNDPEARKAYPDELQAWIRGGLTYAQTLDAYKAFPVHLNFNSAPWSDTMFSRRVVEIAASGTVVYSADGRGIGSTLGEAFPVSADENVYRDCLEHWMTNEAARKTAAWNQMRAVYRAHLSGHALAILFRTLGIPAAAPQPARAAVRVEGLSAAGAAELADQSVRPALVVGSVADDDALLILAHAGIPFRDELDLDNRDAVKELLRSLEIGWYGNWQPGQPRTLLEDLLLGAAFGQWSSIRTVRDAGSGWSPLAAVGPVPEVGLPELCTLHRVAEPDEPAEPGGGLNHLTLVYPALHNPP